MRMSIVICSTLLFTLATALVISPSALAQGAGCLPGALKSRLDQVRRKFGNVQVVSTFRRGARIAGTGRRSLHASCRAVDFTPPRGQYRQVAAWLKQVHGGGVGTYSCGMHHIHIDNGPRVRFHKCVSRAAPSLDQKRHAMRDALWRAAEAQDRRPGGEVGRRVAARAGGQP